MELIILFACLLSFVSIEGLLLLLQVRPNSLFSVEPRQGVIPPEDALQLKVTANVDDTVK